jgi:hypothetical protein
LRCLVYGSTLCNEGQPWRCIRIAEESNSLT